VVAQRRSGAGGAGAAGRAVAPGSATRNANERRGGKAAGPPVGAGALTDYVKVRTCGRGSFGEALLVQHRVTGRECVLKRIRVESTVGEGQPAAAESALREVQVLWRLQHPHIVEFLGAFTDPRDSSGGTLCLLMAFCEGGDLQQRIHRVRRDGQHFQESLVIRLFDQLCNAVAYVHSKNVLHRDLKPSNIFLSGDGEDESVLIGDFGVSRALSHAMELVTTMVGTPCYLSPEVCKGRPYSYKSDIWSLGCVLFEMMALRPPFGQAANLEALVSQIVRAEYVVPDDLGDRYPEAFRCAKAMIRLDPERRPTAQALASRPKINSSTSEANCHGEQPDAPTPETPARARGRGSFLAPRSPTRGAAATGAASATAVANAAVAPALCPSRARDKAQGRSKVASRTVNAKADHENPMQAWNDGDPAQLAAPASTQFAVPGAAAARGRNAQGAGRGASGPGSPAPAPGRQVTRQVSSGAMKRGASQGEINARTVGQTVALPENSVGNSVGARRGSGPGGYPAAVHRMTSQPVRRQLSNGPRSGADQQSERPRAQVYRRRSDDRARSPQPAEDAMASPSSPSREAGMSRSQHGGQVIIATSSDAKLSGPPRRSGPTARSPRGQAMAAGLANRGIPSRREDRVQQSQAFRDWIRGQQAAGIPIDADSAGNALAFSSSASLEPLPSASLQPPPSPGPSGCRTPAYSPSGSIGLSNSPPGGIGPSQMPGGSPHAALSSSTSLALSPEVRRPSWTQHISSGSEGLTADLIRTGGATDASTSLGSPGSTATQSLTASARASARAIAARASPASPDAGHRATSGTPPHPYDDRPPTLSLEEENVDSAQQSVSIGNRMERVRACLEARLGTERFETLYRSLASGSLAGGGVVERWPAATQKSQLPDELKEVFADTCENDIGSSIALVAKLVDCEQKYFS